MLYALTICWYLFLHQQFPQLFDSRYLLNWGSMLVKSVPSALISCTLYKHAGIFKKTRKVHREEKLQMSASWTSWVFLKFANFFKKLCKLKLVTQVLYMHHSGSNWLITPHTIPLTIYNSIWSVFETVLWIARAVIQHLAGYNQVRSLCIIAQSTPWLG